jgi:hypothetical protein
VKLISTNYKGFTHLLIPIGFIVVIGAVGTYVLAASHAAADPDVFKSGISGKCLDNYGNRQTNGNKVDVYTCNNTAAQKWTVEGNGEIESATGQCLEAWPDNGSKGAPIRIYKCSMSNNAELWELSSNTIRLKQHTNLCIDDPYSSTSNGAQQQVYTCNGKKNQQWTPGTVTVTGGGTGGSGSSATTPGGSSGTGTAPGGSNKVGLAPPSGYTTSQMIFDDEFKGTSLNTSNWVTSLGSNNTVWNDNGKLPSPYSGATLPGGTDGALFAPSQVNVNNGLTLTAVRNTNQYSSSYPWLSGVVTTMGKFSLPTTSWYVQASIKVPDMTQGMWPSMWFLPASGSAFDELDFVQGGLIPCNGANDDYCPLDAGYFDASGKNTGETNQSVGFDATQAFHIYGVQWTAGVGIKGYVDGKLVWTVNQSQVPGGIIAQPYEIILNLQVALAKDSGWHSVPNATSPGGSMEVGEVQAYK